MRAQGRETPGLADLGEELQRYPVKRVRLLEVNRVSRPRRHHHLRSRDEALRHLHQRRWHHLIVLPADEQHRRPYRGQRLAASRPIARSRYDFALTGLSKGDIFPKSEGHSLSNNLPPARF